MTSVRPPSSTVVAQQREHLAAGAQVQRAGRLVGEHDLGLADQRPGDRHPLLLAAGELRGAVAGAVAEADRGQRLARPRRAEPPAREPRRQRDVLRGGQRAEQVEGLKDEPEPLAAQPRQRPLAQRARARASPRKHPAGGRPVQPGGGLQQRRLAGARRPHHGGERAALEVER